MVRALVDSGNTVATSAAISSRLASQLGIPFQPLTLTCGTAAEGQTVAVKGLARNVRMALSSTTVVAMGRVLVIDGLTGGLNLGAKLLMELGAGIQFHRDGTATLQVQGEDIPLSTKVQGVCPSNQNINSETPGNVIDIVPTVNSPSNKIDIVPLNQCEKKCEREKPTERGKTLTESEHLLGEACPVTSQTGNTPAFPTHTHSQTHNDLKCRRLTRSAQMEARQLTPPEKGGAILPPDSEREEGEILQVGLNSSSCDPANIHIWPDLTCDPLGCRDFQISEFSSLNKLLSEEFSSKCSSHVYYVPKSTPMYSNVNSVNLDITKDSKENEHLFVNNLTPPEFPFKVRKYTRRLKRSTQSSRVDQGQAGRDRLGVRISSLSPFESGKQVSHRLELVHSVIVPARSVSIASTKVNLRSRRKAFLLEEHREGDIRIAQGIVSEGPDGLTSIVMVNETEDPIQVPAGTRWPCQPLTQSTHLVDADTLLQEPGLAPFPAQDLADLPDPGLPDVNLPGQSPVHSSSGLPDVNPPGVTSPRSQPGIAELDPGDLEDLASQVETDPEFRRIWDELKLGQNTLLAQNPNILKQVRRLVYEYQDIFSTSAPGETDLVELSLKLKEGTEPIRQKGRPMNPAMEANLQAQVEDWLDQGVIEPSDSPWCSPLVPVKKKDGSVRWAVDFRRVNACLEQDSYPLPRIQQLLEKAGGHQVYSALDATQAYFNIRIDPASRKVTAFATPNGLYQFRRMPFGLSVSPAVYSRFIAVALNKLGTKEINSYLDDVLVFNNGLQKHADRLKDVFEAHREAGVKLKPSKTLLFREKVEYLGHMLSKDGISMVDSYVDRIMEWPVPTNIKELNTLLGFFSYYRSFIPGFADLTAAMCSQRREKTLDWTPEMTINLDKLKAEFQRQPVRAPPKFESDEPFQLTTDYSSTAIGAVLSQVQDGQERLIAADGRKTTGPEKRYPSWKGELSAIIRGIRKFSPILSYKPFIINTDSKALVQLKSLKQCTGMLARWSEELAGYDFVVKHRPGKDNLNADALSRSEHMPDPTPEEEEEHDSYIGNLTTPGPSSYPQDLARANILHEQATDPLLRKVREWVVKGQPPEKLEVRGMCRAGQQYVLNFESFTF